MKKIIIVCGSGYSGSSAVFDYLRPKCHAPFGNIEFGFAAVAAIGAQWLCQKLRMLRGENTRAPGFTMGYLTHGQMKI